MSITEKQKKEVTIRFSGDSGDGIQLTGSQFSNTTALSGNDLSTFPDYPAEIRAPAGTVHGVSGFQIHFGSKPIHTPGDMCDVLVVMNAAALKANLKFLKPGGIIIANTDGFGKKDLSLAKYAPEETPIQDAKEAGYSVIEIDVTKMTRESLKDTGLTTKEIDRSKNMFVLGVVYWLYSRPTDSTIEFLKKKFANKPKIAEANIKALNDGFTYGIATEIFSERYTVEAAPIKPGTYRNITGNDSIVLGLAAVAKKSNLPLFLGSYPITPASEILHGLSRLKNYNVSTFQAEDEIAAITSAIGASFGGHLGVTTSSGPGVALKSEAIGLATMLELPLVIVNVQRAGPSTGLPTKTEQADLLQAFYGRAGECPVAIISASSPADCFDVTYEACRLAVEHMIPVMMLTDGYIANGAEPWKLPDTSKLKPVNVKQEKPADGGNGQESAPFLPYKRDENLVRPWAVAGTKGLAHRIGGLEKEHETGNISYDPDNHHMMTEFREKKRDNIAKFIPDQEIDEGTDSGKLLVVGWGSTYGSIKSAVTEALEDGHDVSYIHLRYLSPFPKNLKDILGRFDRILVPEINRGQLSKILRDQFLLPVEGYNRVRGVPFTVAELKTKIVEMCTG
ncbi:2-oxoacid:acceptor oxidoreductase subunit alpha [Natronogracilivirga saccharolytica]|uniref:2-oxoacid:acceptor oxidoreductase subunit alpha n=1 Tax=Natronogracilivirga saccharolytica TaxID=2812953 RepID=A0A8J7S808_9BACT|nr:2-oxoacid:acceptor oxidoreductase subunit alpha [Natronogracilivirga saccharolytica]MBP3193633.1 2-oxoacid:acceptor oxidoreductase subunit alpha [Natronogracilivirga saccharolytica]